MYDVEYCIIFVGNAIYDVIRRYCEEAYKDDNEDMLCQLQAQ